MTAAAAANTNNDIDDVFTYDLTTANNTSMSQAEHAKTHRQQKQVNEHDSHLPV